MVKWIELYTTAEFIYQFKYLKRFPVASVYYRDFRYPITLDPLEWNILEENFSVFAQRD